MIYLDNAATTKVSDEVSDFLSTYYKESYFNPSALYEGALQIEKDITKSRKIIANALGCQSEEIIFTSGGSESNNTAIFGSIKNKKGRVITTLGEHMAVYSPFVQLKNRGFDVQFAKLNKKGQIDLEHFASLLNKDTVFVSVIHASNETGAINDIKQIVQLAKSANPNCIVHSDGVQAFFKTDFNVKLLDVDLYSISGHKIHCPKGIGALYIKKGVKINPLIYGASQEYGLRAGTENSALICALGLVCNNMYKTIDERINHCRTLKNTFLEIIKNEIDDYVINGNEKSSLANILSLSFAGIKSEILIQMMSDKGIYLGSGSACSSKQKVSRVLKEALVPSKYIEGSIRISFSYLNTVNEIEIAAKCLTDTIKQLREMIK